MLSSWGWMKLKALVVSRRISLGRESSGACAGAGCARVQPVRLRQLVHAPPPAVKMVAASSTELLVDKSSATQAILTIVKVNCSSAEFAHSLGTVPQLADLTACAAPLKDADVTAWIIDHRRLPTPLEPCPFLKSKRSIAVFKLLAAAASSGYCMDLVSKKFREMSAAEVAGCAVMQHPPDGIGEVHFAPWAPYISREGLYHLFTEHLSQLRSRDRSFLSSTGALTRCPQWTYAPPAVVPLAVSGQTLERRLVGHDLLPR